MARETRKGGGMSVAVDRVVGSAIGTEDILGVRNHKGEEQVDK